MLVIAHRGLHAHVPENTLAAFEAAVDLGVDGIETDIRLTADRVPVLFHDRVAPDGRDVADVRRDDLARLVGHAVPTVDEALARFPSPLWVLEVKTPDALEATIEAVRRWSASRRIVVISFWHTLTDAVARRLDVDCGLLVCHRPLKASDLAPHWPQGASRVPAIVWNFEFLDQDILREATVAGLRNFVWGLQTEADHRRCLEWQVDAIITDQPELLAGEGGKGAGFH